MATRPGDLILNRYMRDASAEEREAARERLRCLARILIRIEERIAHDIFSPTIRKDGLEALDST